MATQNITLTVAAQLNVDETSADVAADLAALRSGAHTRESLLAHCLDGADADRMRGWHEYVDALVDAASASATLTVSELLAQLADLNDGTGTLRTVVECALRDDPEATADDVRAIWAEATTDAEVMS